MTDKSDTPIIEDYDYHLKADTVDYFLGCLENVYYGEPPVSYKADYEALKRFILNYYISRERELNSYKKKAEALDGITYAWEHTPRSIKVIYRSAEDAHKALAILRKLLEKRE